MAKKKSKKITSRSKTKGKGVKSTKKSKVKVSKGTSKKKPLKSKKTPKKPITWVNKTKQKLQLSRKQDKNRYQNLISVISDYYKQVGSPLKRADLYDEYRRIRDNFSNWDLNDLIADFENIAIKQTKRAGLPQYLTLPIPWYNFEQQLTTGASQNYFKSKSQIVLNLDTIQLPADVFQYSTRGKGIIGAYRRLYRNSQFRRVMKTASPPPCFIYDSINSDPQNDFYIWVLDECPTISPTQAPPQGPQPGGVIYQTPLPQTGTGTGTGTPSIIPTMTQAEMDFSRESDIRDLLKSLFRQKAAFAEMLRDKTITFNQYSVETDNINEKIEDLENQLK